MFLYMSVIHDLFSCTWLLNMTGVPYMAAKHDRCSCTWLLHMTCFPVHGCYTCPVFLYMAVIHDLFSCTWLLNMTGVPYMAVTHGWCSCTWLLHMSCFPVHGCYTWLVFVNLALSFSHVFLYRAVACTLCPSIGKFALNSHARLLVIIHAWFLHVTCVYAFCTSLLRIAFVPVHCS